MGNDQEADSEHHALDRSIKIIICNSGIRMNTIYNHDEYNIPVVEIINIIYLHPDKSSNVHCHVINAYVNDNNTEKICTPRRLKFAYTR